MALAAATSLITALAVPLSGCGGAPEPAEPSAFSRDAYCRAMRESATLIDSEALNNGDAEAMDEARAAYSNLAALAPTSLRPEWDTIIEGLDAMIAQANGQVPVSPEAAKEFRRDYSTVYEDYAANCLESPSPS
jgi:hypothetical protein